MVIRNPTPIPEQASWRLWASLIILGLFAALFLATPVYVVWTAESGHPAVWAFVLLFFWSGAVALVFAARPAWLELRARGRVSA